MALLEEREERESKEVTQARPCPGSERIAGGRVRDGRAVHQKLYEDAKRVKMGKELEEGRKVKGDRPGKGEQRVDQRLVKDAKKRQERRKAREEEKNKGIRNSALPKGAVKSQEYTFKKFKKEYDAVVSGMEKQKKTNFSYQEL